MKKTAVWTGSIFAGAMLAYTLVPRKPRVVAGQVAIITGGSRGLGLAMAHEFGRAGVKLVLAARKQDELEQARKELLASGDVAHEDDIQLIVADVTDPEQAAGIIEQTLQVFGNVDILINNAAIIEVGPFGDQPIDAYYRAMQVTYFAALHTIQAVVPHMASRGSGAIVNISSIGGKVPVPHLLPYVGAKFALTGFSEGLHAELRQKGIRVTTVCPGLMRTGGGGPRALQRRSGERSSLVQVLRKDSRTFKFGRPRSPAYLRSGAGRTRRDHNLSASLAGGAYRRAAARDEPVPGIVGERVFAARSASRRAASCNSGSGCCGRAS